MYFFAIDNENNAEAWWDAAREQVESCPVWAGRLLIEGGGSSAQLSELEAKMFRRWCESLPGWDGGPDHAPHPIVFSEE